MGVPSVYSTRQTLAFSSLSCVSLQPVIYTWLFPFVLYSICTLRGKKKISFWPSPIYNFEQGWELLPSLSLVGVVLGPYRIEIGEKTKGKPPHIFDLNSFLISFLFSHYCSLPINLHVLLARTISLRYSENSSYQLHLMFIPHISISPNPYIYHHHYY